jgi:hypothetical protein
LSIPKFDVNHIQRAGKNAAMKGKSEKLIISKKAKFGIKLELIKMMNRVVRRAGENPPPAPPLSDGLQRSSSLGLGELALVSPAISVQLN